MAEELEQPAEQQEPIAEQPVQPVKNENFRWYILHAYSGFERKVKESIESRIQAFGLTVNELDTSDVLQIQPVAWRMLAEIRASSRPQALILNTERFGPHSKSDDTRSEEMIEQLKASRDPLKFSEARISKAELEPIRTQVDEEVGAAFAQALTDPFPAWEAQP